jgi:hypothetical protein
VRASGAGEDEVACGFDSPAEAALAFVALLVGVEEPQDIIGEAA